MTPEERAREALLRCIDKPLYLEAYQPETAAAIRAAVEAEREACALLAEWSLWPDDVARPSVAKEIAAAIRARGKVEQPE